MTPKDRTLKIIQKLKKDYPNAKCALNFNNPIELLIGTILSAQCTDKRVNIVTPSIFKKYKTAKDFANAKPTDMQTLIRSTGFYVNKTKNIIGAFKLIESKHGGKVPHNLEELVKLPGVGRKTANVILGNAYETQGIVVDTHMLRINKRLGLCSQTDPVKMEFALMKLVPKSDWTKYSHLITHHGRVICKARKPMCTKCSVFKICPKKEVTVHA
jgi:endonuclease III